METLTQKEIVDIRSNPDKVCWYDISANQNLSEKFIREFSDKVNWYWISASQKLSEKFIREFSDKVNWYDISIYQKLSEKFIREFSKKVNWICISTYQKLSEKFIREFSDKVDLNYISRYQNLSASFCKEFNIKIPDESWIKKTVKEKEAYIKKHTSYKIVNGKVIAYKSCRKDGYSKFNFQYKYRVGSTYESHANYNPNEENSFGLSAWTKERAFEYCNERLFRVAINLEDIACIVQDGKKIRATKIEILTNVAPPIPNVKA